MLGTARRSLVGGRLVDASIEVTASARRALLRGSDFELSSGAGLARNVIVAQQSGVSNLLGSRSVLIQFLCNFLISSLCCV